MEKLLKTAKVLVSNGNQSILAGSAPARSLTGTNRCNAVDAVIGFIAPVSVCQFMRRIDSSFWHCGCRVVSQDIPDVFTTPAKVFARYVDDIFRSIKSADIDALFESANALHPNLKFRIEYEVNGKILLLDMMIERGDN